MEIAVGLVIGGILGLTGAGGAAFALPLLVLLMGLPVQQAIGLSLATVALSAGYGAMRRLNSGDIFWWAVLCLSLGGVIAAPAGKYLATFVPDAWLLTGFTLLCLGIASHMWRRCLATAAAVSTVAADTLFNFGADGRFQPRARSVGALALSGLGVGSLSGLFGVGGGFLVVPLLHGLIGISLRQAMASSLLIIALVSSAGFATHLALSPATDWVLLSQLGIGATAGMYLGSRVAECCSPSVLQKSFAASLMILAAATLAKIWLQGI